MKVTILLDDGRAGAYFFTHASVNASDRVLDAVGTLLEGQIEVSVTGFLKQK